MLGETVRVSTLLEKDPSLVMAHHEGAKIWTIDKDWTPLTYCVSSRVRRDCESKKEALVQTARALRDHGADVTGCVDLAIYTGNLEIVEMLLKAGGTPINDDNLNHVACEVRGARAVRRP